MLDTAIRRMRCALVTCSGDRAPMQTVRDRAHAGGSDHRHRESRGPVRLVCGALVLAFVWLLVVAANAQAVESVTVTFGPDPTEEVPLPIRMTWTTADPDPFVVLTSKRTGVRGCGATHAIDDPYSTDILTRPGGSTATAFRTLRRFAGPGSRTLCGYLQRSPVDAAPLARTGPITVPVRSARASVAISAPVRVAPRQAFALNVSVTAELRRYVVVTNKRAGARGCAPSHALDDPVSRDVLVSYLQGTQTRTQMVLAPRMAGTYLLCAYVQEGGRDRRRRPSVPRCTSLALIHALRPRPRLPRRSGPSRRRIGPCAAIAGRTSATPGAPGTSAERSARGCSDWPGATSAATAARFVAAPRRARCCPRRRQTSLWPAQAADHAAQNRVEIAPPVRRETVRGDD